MNRKPKNLFLDDLLETIRPRWRELIAEIRDRRGLRRELAISGGRSLELAAETDLVFCKDDGPARLKALLASQSCFIVLPPVLARLLPDDFSTGRVLIITAKPRFVMALLLLPFRSDEPVARQRQRISRSATIAAGVRLGPGVVIGPDTQIGPNCVIGPNTVIDHARIGPNCVIGANCTIGLDSFGYELDEATGEAVKFVHFGLVRMGEDVEILSNACVCRGSLNDTIIEDHVKIGHLVNVGHNVLIGRGALVTGSDVLGGSSVVGASAWLAPSTTLMNGITFGDRSMTGLGSIVTRSVGENEIVAGVPARRLRKRYPERGDEDEKIVK